jgi:hypothetical protein
MSRCPSVRGGIGSVSEGVKAILLKDGNSLAVEVDVDDPEVNRIASSGGIEGMENTGGVNQCGIGGWHISLII